MAIGLLSAACAEPSRDAIGVTFESDSRGRELRVVSGRPAQVPEWSVEWLSWTLPGIPDDEIINEVTTAQWLSDGRFVLADGPSRRLHVFSVRLHIRSLGGQGDGPRGLRRLGTVSLHSPDTVAAYDPAAGVLKGFDLDSGAARILSHLHEAAATPVIEAWAWGPERHVLLQYLPSPPDAGLVKYGAALLLGAPGLDASIARRDDLSGPTSAWGAAGELRLPFSFSPSVAVADAELVVAPGPAFEILRVDSLLETTQHIRWPEFERAIAPEELDAVSQELFGRPVARGGPVAQAMLTGGSIPDRRPTIGRLIAGDSGEIWVVEFEPLLVQPADRRWYVLDDTGRPVGRISLQRELRARLLDVQGDTVLVVRRDDLDVPHVEMGVVRRRPE